MTGCCLCPWRIIVSWMQFPPKTGKRPVLHERAVFLTFDCLINYFQFTASCLSQIVHRHMDTTAMSSKLWSSTWGRFPEGKHPLSTVLILNNQRESPPSGIQAIPASNTQATIPHSVKNDRTSLAGINNTAQNYLF